MSDTRHIVYHDIRAEALARRLPTLIGRTTEIDRLDQIRRRRINNNALVIGPSGIGKTTTVYGFLLQLAHAKDGPALVQLNTSHLRALEDELASEEILREALASIPESVVFIDDLGRELYQHSSLVERMQRLYTPLLRRDDVHVIGTIETHEYAWLEREHPALTRAFERVVLKEQSAAEYTRIIGAAIPHLNRHRILVPDSALAQIVAHVERFPSLGQLPRAGIHLLDESLSLASARHEKVLTDATIGSVVETKTGIPQARLAVSDLGIIRDLEAQLSARVIGQKKPIAKIAAHLQRAKLGLKNPHRPLGSFLLLGPSGVGKTETAKCVAERMFGRSESFLRFDMSEFQQDHTVQRLIGAPAGYVGFEQGGALTNALKREPHSLILLDEIEKAHPKIFDVFLQVLDDGRLTSGQNDTVDAKHAIIMATSNVGVSEIMAAHARNRVDDEQFITENLMPLLQQTFRPEFLNRFDAILIYRPLSVPSLLKIAELEIRKIETRLAKHRIRFEIEPRTIEARIKAHADPRFGARPVKRFIEETCETLLMRSLLAS